MPSGGSKKAGKAEWAGRRRPPTRRSGFAASAKVEAEVVWVSSTLLKKGRVMVFTFHLPEYIEGERVGFGGWFHVDGDIAAEVIDSPAGFVLTANSNPDWNKVGSQWVAKATQDRPVQLHLHSRIDTMVALYGLQCGIIEHEHLTRAKPELLANMWRFAPEANLYNGARTGKVTLEADQDLAHTGSDAVLHLKSCNRCGRFLPINIKNERAHLSFTNHCVAHHRRPCNHPSFGCIRLKDSDSVLKLECGFQLECRFCKKFEVNAPLNPQRTTSQMREDGQRRRGLELLIEHLHEGSSQMQYRHQTGTELVDAVFARFGGCCFKCRTPFPKSSDIRLDHTRPLALLWPLDESATALCSTCNSCKRDRSPVEFYTEAELRRLSRVTGLALDMLKDPSPNPEVVESLRDRPGWFFNEFLSLPALQEIKDGKRTGDLLIKALDKALRRTPGGAPYTMADLRREA